MSHSLSHPHRTLTILASRTCILFEQFAPVKGNSIAKSSAFAFDTSSSHKKPLSVSDVFG